MGVWKKQVVWTRSAFKFFSFNVCKHFHSTSEGCDIPPFQLPLWRNGNVLTVSIRAQFLWHMHSLYSTLLITLLCLGYVLCPWLCLFVSQDTWFFSFFSRLKITGERQKVVHTGFCNLPMFSCWNSDWTLTQCWCIIWESLGYLVCSCAVRVHFGDRHLWKKHHSGKKSKK